MKDAELLENLEKFFEVDIYIKKMFTRLFPTDKDFYFNETYRYVEKLSRFLDQVKLNFVFMSRAFGLNYLEKELDSIFENLKIKLNAANNDRDKIMNFYNKYIIGMNNEFLDEVKVTCVGYSLFGDFYGTFKKATSLNEMLHFFHSYVMNNEKIYEALPVIEQKKNDISCPITMYGKSSFGALEIYDNFPLDLEFGYSDIVSLKDVNKVIMMIRDRGHALTIEVTYEDNNVLVEYFIPKLCNIEMINKLKGVIKVNENVNIHSGTTGRFVVSRDKLCEELFDFISKVPMDSDMNFDFKGLH